MTLKGKTAIVTGAAGQGMGRSIALTLAREGARVVINYRKSAESAAAIVNHIQSRGGQAVACQADINQHGTVPGACPGGCKSIRTGRHLHYRSRRGMESGKH